MLLLVLYSAVWEPYKAAFLPASEGFYQYLVDSCYWLDLLLAFSTGYLRGGYEVVLDKREIALHYLRSWFTVQSSAAIIRPSL
jgi:hypothetical protein